MHIWEGKGELPFSKELPQVLLPTHEGKQICCSQLFQPACQAGSPFCLTGPLLQMPILPLLSPYPQQPGIWKSTVHLMDRHAHLSGLPSSSPSASDITVLFNMPIMAARFHAVLPIVLLGTGALVHPWKASTAPKACPAPPIPYPFLFDPCTF